MPKVMVLEHQLENVIPLENILKTAGYDVGMMTGPYSILAKFDLERPDILLLNPEMPHVNIEALLDTLMSSPGLKNMIIVLICNGDPDAIENTCRRFNLHGYYMLDAGLEGIVDYLANFSE